MYLSCRVGVQFRETSPFADRLRLQPAKAVIPIKAPIVASRTPFCTREFTISSHRPLPLRRNTGQSGWRVGRAETRRADRPTGTREIPAIMTILLMTILVAIGSFAAGLLGSL